MGHDRNAGWYEESCKILGCQLAFVLGLYLSVRFVGVMVQSPQQGDWRYQLT